MMLLSSACARELGQHGSAAKHDEAAKVNEELAAAHAKAGADAAPCLDSGEIYDICWSKTDTPAAHAELAKRHRLIAASHARAADALTRAENEACEGVAQRDRETSPLLRFRDITSTQLLDTSTAENELEIPVVRAVFADVPGLDASALQRLADCHLARNAALGHDVPEMDDCPLVPHGVRAEATLDRGQLSLTVFADQANLGEVRRRAELLVQQVEGRKAAK